MLASDGWRIALRNGSGGTKGSDKCYRRMPLDEGARVWIQVGNICKLENDGDVQGLHFVCLETIVISEITLCPDD